MAQYRPEISNKTKKLIRSQAGNKCANPGCSNVRTHIHHIREWAIYHSHDSKYLIAVCPSCHDAIHHGSIKLTDEILYQWKSVQREAGTVRGHIYIEPGETTKILLGSIAITSPNKTAIFKLSESNTLQFSVVDGEILLMSLKVTSISGTEVLKVESNHITHSPQPGISFNQVPGSISVMVPNSDDYLPNWVAEKMRIQEPEFGLGQSLTILEMSVMKPGLIRVEGIWVSSSGVVVITKERLSFLTQALQQPLSLVGEGEDSVLKYAPSGVVDLPMFGFGQKKNL